MRRRFSVPRPALGGSPASIPRGATSRRAMSGAGSPFHEPVQTPEELRAMLVDLAKRGARQGRRPRQDESLSMPSQRARALLIVLDSVGIGGAEDARGLRGRRCRHRRPYRGSLRGRTRRPRGASRGAASSAASCRASASDLPAKPRPDGFRPISRRSGKPRGAYGYGVETSRGKDTPSGHWEIAGVPVDFDWGYFPAAEPCFPSALTEALIREGELPGILGNRHASGTAIVEELGAESVAERQADLLHLGRQRLSDRGP